MSARALLCVALALFAQPVYAESRDDRKPITTVERQLEQIRAARQMLRDNLPYALRDARGRAKSEDVEQWAYSPEIEQRIEARLNEARAAKPAAADAALADARQTVETAMARALEIASYWSQSPTIVWRDRWKAFAVANGLPAEPYDERIVAAEKTAIDFLNSGDFARAASAMGSVEAELQAALNAATTRLARDKDPATLVFVPRLKACPQPGAPPEQFYPPSSKRLQEQGVVVVRARADETGCGTAFAVVVSSGYPALDQAALKIAEGNHFEGNSEITFKVRFETKIEPQK